MSTIWLFEPAIDDVSNGVERCVCWRRARALRRWPAMMDLDALSLVAQATVGVLSQNKAMCLCFKVVGAICSRTSHASRSPAISKSEFEMVPFLLAFIMVALISAGHSSLHTVGSRGVVPPSHTPPAPVLQASTYPIKFGSPGFNSRTDVGLEAKALISVDQSLSACCSCGFRCIVSGVFISAWFIGEKSPLPLGMPKEACCSLPASSWKSWSVVVLAFTVALMRLMIVLAFCCGN